MKKYRKPYKLKRKKSILESRFFWLVILFLIFIGTIFYLLFFSRFFQIDKIIVIGEKKVSKEEIIAVIENNLEKKILFFPTKSIFLTNLNQIEKEILIDFPKISEVKIDKIFPDTLNIILTERLEVAIFCQNDSCFLLDREGVIFEESEPKIDFIKINDGQKEKIPKLGEKTIEKDYLDKIFKIQKNLSEDLKIEVEEFFVFEERLNIKTKEGWEIYFDPKGDLNWQITKLSLVLEKEIPPEKRGNLEYIDLRFTRVYYKYR